MKSVFKASKPFLSVTVAGEKVTFDTGEHHTELQLLNRQDILAFREWMQEHPLSVDLYGIKEKVIEAESEYDTLTEWDRNMISRMK